jgi:replicative DNA helicase
MSDHERQVLGAMLVSAAAIDEVTAILTGPDFANPRHEVIFDAVLAQVADGRPVDAVTIGDRVDSGRAYLHELVAGLITASSADYHALKVRDAARLRKVHEVGARLEALAGADDDPLDIVNAARQELDALLDVDTDDSHESAVYAAIEALSEPIGVATPWRAVSDTIGGWAPGMLYIAGARPGVGKTVLGIGALLDIGRRGQTGMMFSLEMPKTELYLRMLSATGSVAGDRLTHRATRLDDDQRLAEAAAHIARLPLVVDDRSAMSLAQIRAKVRSQQRKTHVGLVIVDYLGLVKPPPDAPRHDRRVQVDAIAQGLKNLARDLRVPILALAQLNRGIEGRADKMPALSDLRESGGIEAAADVVLLMHRATNEIHGDVTDLTLFFAKNRHGPQALCHLNFEGPYSRATDQPHRLGATA